MTSASRPPGHERAARFDLLVSSLRVMLRHGDPDLADHALLAEAEYFAARRLMGSDLVPLFVTRP